MKKLILGISVLCLMFGTISTQTANAACYEPYYPAVYCDTQGFENCVNYICPPPPSCGLDDDCNDDPVLG